MASGPKFADLVPRLVSAFVLLGVAGLGLWLGGPVLALLLSVLGAVMLWEYFRLIVRLTKPFAMGATVITAALLAVSLILEDRFAVTAEATDSALPQVLAPAPVALIVMALAMLAVMAVVRKSWLETAFGAMIPAATFLFFYLHQSVPAAMWLVVATVIATDVAGYFFGKLIGGPKFWPTLSPNKTWAGTVSGWLCAALIAVAVGWSSPFGTVIVGVLFLMVVSFAAQMSDIAESALKRRAGVKDSSNLLPGHGGVLDRFDGMMGGFLVAGLTFVLVGYAMVP
ncbi:phosphatidate cytidylyltransferase [Gymnodinialimonas sp. 2305UL16-5]|uniref:phosphatidate cytidylyltransferase n=1 Tax=Gymnodinialimonas mytili TaxID=3126503 RepID=UPI0030A82144